MTVERASTPSRCGLLDMFPYAADDWSSKRHVGNEMPVHNVYMQPIRPVAHRVRTLIAE